MAPAWLPVILLVATFCAVCDAQYGPDPDGVPPDFLCGWRQLAYNHSVRLRPDSVKCSARFLQQAPVTHTLPLATMMDAH